MLHRRHTKGKKSRVIITNEILPVVVVVVVTTAFTSHTNEKEREREKIQATKLYQTDARCT